MSLPNFRLKRQQTSLSGQGLSEYTLIGTLITLSAIVAIGLTGGKLADVFRNLKGDLSHHIEQAKTDRVVVASLPVTTGGATPNIAAPPALPPQSTQTASPPSSTPVSKGLRLTTKSGATLELANYPNDIAKSVYTAGANGTTTILANSIQMIADAQLASGAISPSQYNSLIALANKGHELANIQAAMESAAQSSRSFSSATMTVNGKKMSIEDLSLEIGFRNYDYNGILPSNPLSEPAYGEVQKFITLYQTVVKNGSLNDPTVKAIVTDASTQIMLITEAVNQTGYQLYNNYINSSAFLQNTASTLIHNNAATICTSGNGTDSGIQCAG